MEAFQQKQHLFSSSRFYLTPKPSINLLSDWVALLSSKHLSFTHVSHFLWNKKTEFCFLIQLHPSFHKTPEGKHICRKDIIRWFYFSHQVWFKKLARSRVCYIYTCFYLFCVLSLLKSPKPSPVTPSFLFGEISFSHSVSVDLPATKSLSFLCPRMSLFHL